MAAVLIGGSPTISSRVTLADESTFSVGDKVDVTLVGTVTDRVEGTVARKSEFVADEAQAAGFDIAINVIRLPEGAKEGAAVTVSPKNVGATSRAVAVPLVSLREDSKGMFVLVVPLQKDPDTAQARRVEIEAGKQHDGWVEIVSGEVAPGNRVIVSGA